MKKKASQQKLMYRWKRKVFAVLMFAFCFGSFVFIQARFNGITASLESLKPRLDRKPQIAFLFIARNRLPLEFVWDTFFQVSKVSDVLSIGQYITMMCIETDVRGNIKLSLKALLPKPERKPASDPEKNPAVKDSSTVYIEASSVGETVASMPSIATPPQKSKLAVPAVVIRTAVECDEAEKSSPVDKNNKPKSVATVKPDRKLKSTASKQTATQKEEEALVSTAPEETPDECAETLKQEGTRKSASSKHNSTASIVSDSNLVASSKAKKSTRKEKQSENEAEEGTSVSTRKLKIGTEMTAKVEQVRTRGLVLDLGGEIRGMYKFEEDEETEFEIGDTLQVKCTSFTTKGIPVMALVDEDED